MRTMSYSESCADLAATLDSVVERCEGVVITRDDHEPVVIVPLVEYEALREIAHLCGSPENTRRLVDGIEQLESGHGVERGMID